jgi:hypothetical protein
VNEVIVSSSLIQPPEWQDKFYFFLGGNMFPDFFSFSVPDYCFHRPMLERQGYYTAEKDNKLYILLNVLGVSKKDIQIDVKAGDGDSQVLSVIGSTHNDVFDKEFEVRMSFIIRKAMQEVNWDVENGFMTLEISFNEPVKPAVKILSK